MLKKSENSKYSRFVKALHVEHIDLDDTFELEDMFHTRSEIIKRFDKLS